MPPGSWGAGSRDDHCNSLVSQIGRQRWEPIVLTVRVAVFDRHVSAFGITCFAQPFTECSKKMRKLGGRGTVEIPDHRHRRLLLCARRGRPRRRAAEGAYKFSSSEVTCHVTLRLGVIHAMERLYHASIARSVTKALNLAGYFTSSPSRRMSSPLNL